MLTHQEMVAKMLNEPAVKAEYDAQAEELAGATGSGTNPCASTLASALAHGFGNEPVAPGVQPLRKIGQSK